MFRNLLKHHYGKLWVAYALVAVFTLLRPVNGFVRTILLAGFLAFSLAWLILPIHEKKAGREPAQIDLQATFLCDSCKYDYGSVCHRPERPNATQCDDYKAG